jgi:hypothetical protein
LTMEVFIVGSGRSGTHWLARIFGRHPHFRTTVEKRGLIDRARRVAEHAPGWEQHAGALANAYREERRLTDKVGVRHYLDKSQQVIWFPELVQEVFPEARFVGIYREPKAAVASMLKHGAIPEKVLPRWKLLPVPNRYFGITESVSKFYDNMPPVPRCTLYWLSHRLRLEFLKEAPPKSGGLGDKLVLVSHEDLVSNGRAAAARLSRSLGLSPSLEANDAAPATLVKWTSDLTLAQQRAIDQVLLNSDLVGEVAHMVSTLW